MQAGSVYRIRTNSANYFTGALAQNAAATAILNLFEEAGAAPVASTFSADKMGIGAGKHCRCRIREVRIISVENLAWEIWLFATSTIGGAVIGSEKLLGIFSFDATQGRQATGDTFYYYYQGGLDLSYENLMVPQDGKFFLRLVNRSAAGKSADAAGAVEVELAVELLQGR